MRKKERSLQHGEAHARSTGLKMSSLLNSSSQFDKGQLSTTVDGTQVSIQHAFDMYTDVDPAEQRHNAMNLALGKPTQSFRDRKLAPINRKQRGHHASVGDATHSIGADGSNSTIPFTNMLHTGYTNHDETR